jgi:hypothetical protein
MKAIAAIYWYLVMAIWWGGHANRGLSGRS